ncbi:MAG: DHH family phosphoesterase [Solobacterium sp.]|nr:DHH family phosphoesterase [Solobacterium sp.]
MTYQLLDIRNTEQYEKYGLSPLCEKVFAANGLREDQIEELLAGDDVLHTSHAPCVRAACERILAAKQNREKVFVGGDYDADGICSTAIMKKTLDLLHIENGYYIPDRFKEGYGLSAATVRLAYEKGYSLIMTVDNGVKAFEAMAEARRLNLDLIITDHHRIEEEIDADIVVHPDYMEPEYEYLSGAGVALEISRCLIGEDDELTAMAAVAAIADVMPVWHETRRIILKGLSVLRQKKPRSLYALLYPGSPVTMRTVAFQIVPKLNSVGRMNDLSNVNTVPRYLLAKDERTLSSYALQISQVNDARKALSDAQAKLAEELISDDAMPVICREDFHEGICGLIAGRISSTVHKPVLIMTRNEDLYKGSGRSVPGFDLFAFLAPFPELCAFGGHEQAVGLSVRREDMPAFLKRVKEKMQEVSLAEISEETPAILISGNDITIDAVMDLEGLQPLSKEIYTTFVLPVKDPLPVYETAKVVKYEIPCAAGRLEAVLYRRKNINVPADIRYLFGHLTINRWKGRISCQFDIENME